MQALTRMAARLLILFIFLLPASTFAGPSVDFKDAAGRTHSIDGPPEKVVSLVPAVTEILFRIGAGDAVRGVTYHDTYPAQAATKAVVGGFFAPSVERIAALKAEVVFIDDIHQSVVDAFADRSPPRLVQLPLDTFEDLYQSIRLLGRIFDKERAAEDLIGEIEADLVHTAAKVASIPAGKRRRVMRLMGRDRVMTSGDDSFQNEMIRRAGGIAPQLGKPGDIVEVTLDEWRTFNPQVVYDCGDDRKAAMELLSRSGWREVDAVKNGRVLYFPCDLTCRLATRTGYFVSCLATQIYGDELAVMPSVRPDGQTASHAVPLALEYVKKAQVVESTVNDYVHKTLLVDLAQPMAVASTLEGFREKIRHVGNSYSPPQVWGWYHRIGLATSRKQLMDSLGRDPVDTSLLFTGADMENLSIQRRQYQQMTVYALVTAGVRSNAVRMSEDMGAYYEPGTINMIILANMRLSPRAMNRAIISATEAKTAALQDLDIRSSYTPMINPATGTGTDNIIIVQGVGTRIDNAGGHSKMGELIAKSVYAGVQEAIFKQNGIVARRHLVQRLKERKISLFGLLGDCSCDIDDGRLTLELERLLMDPRIAGFIEAALAVSDDYQRGLVTDIQSFAVWCDSTAAAIAGGPIPMKKNFPYSRSLPPVLKMAFDALLNGAYARIHLAESID